MEKQPFTFAIMVQLTKEKGVAERIADMFLHMEEVSFVRDIAPVIFDQFQYKNLDQAICTEASEEIETALEFVNVEGYTMKCVPQFEPTLNETMQLCDLIYKRTEKW